MILSDFLAQSSHTSRKYWNPENIFMVYSVGEECAIGHTVG